MVILNGHSTGVQHRHNRRRERPGSRTRRTVPRKANSQHDYKEGIIDARDDYVPLPSDRARPSPTLRQNFDQSWQRWKAREAEEKALADMDQMQADQERIFGGEFGDDELYSLGILYDTDEDIALDSESNRNTVSCDVPVEASIPTFILRHGRPRHSRRRLHSDNLPLYLSFSNLTDDTEIARLLSPSISHEHTTRHRRITFSDPIVTITPQSLPTPSALESAPGSPPLHNSTTTSIPPTILDQNAGDWEIISTPQCSTPTLFSEPETWILIDDLQQIPH